MKILILGLRPFLSLLLDQMKDGKFLREHEIWVMMADHRKDRPEFKRGFKNLFKKIRHWFKGPKKLEQMLLNYDLWVYKKNLKIIMNELNPLPDVSFLSEFKNIKFIQYPGDQNLKKIMEFFVFDLMIIATFAKKLSKPIYTFPRLGTINIHPSILPSLRGGDPTYVQLCDTRYLRGSTLMEVDDGWDTGPIISQKESLDYFLCSNAELRKRAAVQAGYLLEQLNLNHFQWASVRQDETKATDCLKVLKFKTSVSQLEPGDDVISHVAANIRHAFPSFYGIYKNSPLYILALEKIDPLSLDLSSAIRLIKKESEFFLQVGPCFYQITRWVYRGQFFNLIL